MNRRAALLLGILVALLIAYIFYWFDVKANVVAQYNTWQKEQTAAGATISPDISVGGFPFAVTLRSDNFKYERADAFRINIPDLKLSVNPLTPFRITATSESPAKFYFFKANYTFTTKSLMVSVARPLFKARGKNDNGLFVQVRLTSLGLDESHKVALGNLVQELSFKAKVKGVSPMWDDKKSVEAWRDSEGSIDLDRVFLNWGSLLVNAKGNLVLDKDNQPNATLSSTISGYEQAIDVLRDQNQVQPIVASVIKAALKLLEDPKTPPGEVKTIRVPVTIKDSKLSIAGVDITSWDPYPVP
ncbi:MAG: DUF2125 domain-containing protein [Alphaproteobacteria bacterium]|nr:DUF2125 domain-containing protein [Alphaproteobacteria bacterium]